MTLAFDVGGCSVLVEPSDQRRKPQPVTTHNRHYVAPSDTHKCRLWAGVYPSARFRNAAICPRVTLSSGQNLSLTGGLQPKVTFAVPSLSMAFSKR